MQHEIISSEKVPFTYRIAGMGSRLLAGMIDLSVFALLLLVGIMFGMALDFVRGGLGTGVIAIWFFALMCGYFTLSEWLWLGQTPGKRVLGIRVMHWDGSNISLGQSALRNLLLVVDILPGLFGVGILVAMSNRQQRRLGDLAANTLVVHSKPLEPPPRVLVAPTEAEKAWQQHLKQTLDKLTREQKKAILDLYVRRDQLRFSVRTRLFSEIAVHLNNAQGLQPRDQESDEKLVSQMASLLNAQ